MIGIMIIVPSLNIVLSDVYMEEGKVTLNERIVILNTIGHLVWTQASHYALWQKSMDSSFSSADFSLVAYQSAKNATQENSAIL